MKRWLFLVLALFFGNIQTAVSQTVGRTAFSASYSISNDSIAVISGQSQNVVGSNTFDQVGYYPFQTSLLAIGDQPNSILSVFPNPTSDVVYIQTTGFGEGAALRVIEIFSVDGALILTSVLNSQSESLDLTKLSPGVYTLVLTSSERVKNTYRIVKL